jgi:hypothetical protein
MKIYNDVSLALRNKIRRDLEIYTDGYGSPYNFIALLKFNENETELFQECLKWREMISVYYKASCDAYKMEKIGRFHGVRPIEAVEINHLNGKYLRMIMKFEVESYDKLSWIDWFDVEGKGDGKLIGQMGDIINKRTHPQYYTKMESIFLVNEMIDLSDELLEKIKTEMIIDSSISWKHNDNDHVGLLNFSDNEILFHECIEWMKLAKCHMNALNFLRVDKIGRFKGVRPEGHSGYDFHFRVAEYDEESWEDWFKPLKKDYKINGNM